MNLLVNKIKSYVPLSFEDEIVIRTLFHKKELKKGEYLLEATPLQSIKMPGEAI